MSLKTVSLSPVSRTLPLILTLSALAALSLSGPAISTMAQAPQTPSVAEQAAPAKDPRYAKLEAMLTNVALIGMFTVDNKPMKDLREERYEIKSLQKLPGDDQLWAMEARIAYGQHDVTVPMVLTIQWADQTPVIVMDQMLIPGLGTFSARVVFHDAKYAGTWTHDKQGGHLFGRIEPLEKK